METWAKQRFPVDEPNFAQDEEGKILTVQACYFLAYHIVNALSPAKEVVMDIEPRLQFVFLPHYWFKNLWLEIGLAVAGGKEHYEKRPPTGLVKAAPAPQQKDGVLVTQNDVERVEVFLPIWMVPPIYKHHNDLKMSGPSSSQERFDAMHVQWNLQMPIDYVNFPPLKEAALRGVLGHATWHCRKKEVKVKSQIFLPMAGEAFRHSLGRLTRNASPQYWPLTTSQALAHLDMYKTVTMASMKEIFTQLPHNDIAIRLHAPASLAMASFFFLRLPIGQYGPVSQLSRSEERCTGPFNWGEAHCAGEKVKRKIGPFLPKSLKNQTRTRTQQKGAQPATATRNPLARLPGARAKEEKNTTNKRLHQQILVRLNVLDLQWTIL